MHRGALIECQKVSATYQSRALGQHRNQAVDPGRDASIGGRGRPQARHGPVAISCSSGADRANQLSEFGHEFRQLEKRRYGH